MSPAPGPDLVSVPYTWLRVFGPNVAVFLAVAMTRQESTCDGAGVFAWLSADMHKQTGLDRCQADTVRRRLRDAGILREQRDSRRLAMRYHVNTQALEEAIRAAEPPAPVCAEPAHSEQAAPGTDSTPASEQETGTLLPVRSTQTGESQATALPGEPEPPAAPPADSQEVSVQETGTLRTNRPAQAPGDLQPGDLVRHTRTGRTGKVIAVHTPEDRPWLATDTVHLAYTKSGRRRYNVPLRDLEAIPDPDARPLDTTKALADAEALEEAARNNPAIRELMEAGILQPAGGERL